jgi:hypothetical protein
MPRFNNYIWIRIWKYLYPVSKLNDSKRKETINKILLHHNYCPKCGEFNDIDKCEFCDITIYFTCKNCSFLDRFNFICCKERYDIYGMIN